MINVSPSSVTVSKRRPAHGAGLEASPTVVRLRGEQGTSTDGALCRALARAIAVDDAAVVVDLSEAEPMGLSTLAVIVRAWEFLRLWQRSLTVRSPSPSAQRLMVICHLKDLLGPEEPHGAQGKALASWVEVPSRVQRRPALSAPGPVRVAEHANQGADLGVIDLRAVELRAGRPAQTA